MEASLIPSLDVRVVAFCLLQERLHVLLCAASGDGECFELPGAPVPLTRSLEETATCLLSQLTGIRETYLEQLYTYGEPARANPRLISVVYFALLPASRLYGAPHPSAGWWAVEALPPLTGDHAEIIAYAMRRLRYKLEYSAVGFQLLPERFTLSELQRIYEMILGEKLDKRNFRRRILQAGIIEATAECRTGEGRPARLYRYRPDAVAEVKARRLFP